MVQIHILSGKKAGHVQVVRRFPLGIGRAAVNDLCLDDSGVWDHHLTLALQKRTGFVLQAAADAFVAVNDEPQTSVRLRPGDIISFGSAKLQFWLAAPQQRGLRLREGFVWLLLGVVTGAQGILIFLLLK